MSSSVLSRAFSMDSGLDSQSVSDALGKFYRAGVPLDSGEFKGWWHRIQKSASFTIVKPLSRDAWQYLISILSHAEVSRIQHLVLHLPGGEMPGPMDKLERRLSTSRSAHAHVKGLLGEAMIGVEQLGSVLGTGRFSGLKTLRLLANSANVLSSTSQSASIAAALRTGQFTNLHTLSLPVCDAGAMLDAIVEGGISELSSFSISNTSKPRTSQKHVSQKLDAVLKSGCFKNLKHLEISNGIIDQYGGWEVLIGAIESGLLPTLKSLCLSNCVLEQVNLADLVVGPGDWVTSLEDLILNTSGISAEQVCALVNSIMRVTRRELALKRLRLHGNSLDNRAVGAVVSLATNGQLRQLQELDLGMNSGISLSAYLVKLTECIQRGLLPSLQRLNWLGNPVSDAAIEAIARAYFESESFTTEFDIDWHQVFDLSLRTRVKEYRDRNLRLVGLREKLKEEVQDNENLDDELEDVVPLKCAKVFLCGYPEVGKTKLRRTLHRYLGLRTRFIWETRPNLFKEPRTRGIELSRIEDKNIHGDNLALVVWDLAGQEEYHVLHGTFLADLGFAGGKATTFVIVFRAIFEADVEAKLLYWLRFVASSSIRHVKRHVVIVLNCFDGRHCMESDKRFWMALIKRFATMFCDSLDIHLEPFIVDVRIATVVKPLKDHLFDQARNMLRDVEVPRVCLELQEELKGWTKGERNKHLPLLTWEAFKRGSRLMQENNRFTEKALKIAASYLHEMGEVIYLEEDESESENRSILVPDPEWFCRKVVGQLLLPKQMLEGESSVKVRADGSISVTLFKTFFEHLLVEGVQSDDVISMLELVGLCYRRGKEKIVIPALIREEDFSSIGWDGKGFHGVMGRSLATEDQERSAIPVTLFRRLQVDLAQDLSLGGRGDSEYKSGKSFSSFRIGELLVLIQFDADHMDPTYDRIDILVKSMIQGDPAEVAAAQVKCICEILQKLEVLCFACCPGLRYDIKVVKPSNAMAKTDKMRERKLISLREIKDLLMNGQKYLGWQLNGNPMELKTFLSHAELKELLEIRATEVEAAEDASSDAVRLTEDPNVSSAVPGESQCHVSLPMIAESQSHVSLPVTDESQSHVSLPVTAGSQSHVPLPVTAESQSHVSLPLTAESQSHISLSLTAESKSHVSLPLTAESQSHVSLQLTSKSQSHVSSAVIAEPQSDFSIAKIAESQELFYDCEQDAVTMGLLTEDSDDTFYSQELVIERALADYPTNDIERILRAIQDVKQTVRGESDLTRQHVSKRKKELLSEIRQKNDLLVRRLQAQESFSIKEKERSVPVYMYLTQMKGNSNVWISLRDAFQSTFYLHLLCEAHYDDGFLHEVAEQEGIEMKRNREWLLKISPWLQRSLQVAVMVAKNGGNVYLTGISTLIPDFLSRHGEGLANALESASTMLPDWDESPGGELADALDSAATMELPEGHEGNELQEWHGNNGTPVQPIKLNENFIAQEIVKDLMDKLGPADFAKKIGLRKVLLRPSGHNHVGSSYQAHASVAWICDDCFRKYATRATDITPRR